MQELTLHLARLGHALADFLFPRICCGCDRRIIEYGLVVCAECAELVVPLEPPICPTCGHPEACMESPDRCRECPDGEIHFAAAKGTTAFNGIARRVVQQLKYDSRPEYAPFMASRMAARFRMDFASCGIDVLVPVPLFHARQRQRGFNQSLLLAAGLSRLLSIPVESRALRRCRATASQTRLTRTERAENIRGAFTATHPESIAGRRVLLVDDVFTTGATLNECARVLMAGGAIQVHCLTFAKALSG